MLSSPFFSATDFSAAIIQNPLTVSPSTTVIAAMALMSGMQPSDPSKVKGEGENSPYEVRLSCVLVVEGDRLLGLLTERDMLCLTVQGKVSDSLSVSQVMLPPVLTLRESECTDGVVLASRLQEQNVRHIPILDDLNRVVGLLMPERVQHNGTFYEALAAACPVGIFRTDAAGCCIYVNTRWCQIAGLQGVEAMGFGWIDGLHPEDRERVAAEWTASVENNRPFQLEYRFQNGEGQTTWVYGQAVAERGLAGDIVGYVGTITDISDRQRTQQALEFQIELDRLVASISSHFIQLTSQTTTDSIHQALREIGEFTQVDSSYIFQYCDTEPLHSMTHEWVAPGITPQLQNCQNLPLDIYPWATNLIQNGEIVYVSNSEVLPPEAAIDQQSFQHFGVKSSLAIPLIVGHQVKGFVGFVSFQKPRVWSEDNIRLLKIFADILMNTLKRQQAEAELKDSEQRYSSLAKASPVGIFRADIHGNRLYFNDRWCQMTGMSPEAGMGMGWVNALYPEDRDRVLSQWDYAVQNHIPFQQEYRFQRPDGQVLWVFGQAVAEYDANGKVNSYVGTLTDISAAKQSIAELQQVEIALRQSKETLKLFVKYAPVGIAMMDTNLCYIYASQRWISDYGLGSIDCLEGQSHYDLFPDIPERWQQIHRQCLAGAIERCEEDLFERADGSVQWIRWEIHPWYKVNQDIGGIIMFAEDITPRKQAEASLRESEERLRLALTATNLGLYDLNIKTGDAIVNPEYATMLGYDPSTFKETNAQWIDRLHPEDQTHVAHVYQAYVAGDIPDYQVEFRQRTKSGDWKWILSIGKIVDWDEEGQPLRMLGTHTDISDRKQAELSLQEANQKITTIWESMTDAYVTLDREWRVIYANPAATQIISSLTNLEPTTFLGKTHWEIFPFLVGKELEREYQRAINEQVAVHFELLYEPTGNWFEIHVYPSGVGLGLYFRDISDRKQAEAEHLRSVRIQGELKLLEQILDIVLAGYWDWDIPNNQEYLSPGFKQMFGYQDEELPNRPETWQRLIFAEDLPDVLDCFERHVQSHGEVPCYNEVRYQHKDGSTVWVICSGQVIEWDSEGKPLRMIGCHIDITARKQAEQTLAESAREVEDLYNNAPCGYHSLDGEGRIITINDTELHWLGYTRSELLGKSFADISTAASFLIFQKNYPEFKRRGWVQDIELDLVCKDGSILPIFLSATAVKDAEGNYLHSRSMLYDARDRKQFETSLRRYERIISSTKDGIALLDCHYIYQVANQAYLTWCNKSQDEVIGHSVREVLGSELFDNFIRPRLDQCLTGQTVQYEKWFDFPNVVPQFLSVTYAPYLDVNQTVAGIIVSLRDVTDRKLAEADLIKNRDLREAIFNELADALFLVDAETLLTLDCNQRAVELFGVEDRAELIGIEGHTLQRHQFSEEVLADIAAQVQVQGYWSQEIEYVTRQGNFFWGNIAAKPIVVAGNTINLVRVSDISDRKRVETTLQQTAIQLAATNRELESFSYSVSHDLRAPLRHMSGFVNALRQQLMKHQVLEDPKVTHYLGVIENSSAKMAQLIDGLLSLSRIGRRPMDWQPVPLGDLVETAIALSQTEGGDSCAPRVRPSVEFVIGELPTLMGDSTLLQQVFQNLIDNAIKFSRNAAAPRVEIGSEPDGTVWVKDNGAGFQMEYADKLFSAFQRLHTQAEFEGTGIGLAVVQRIVQRHDGTVWAEGIPQQGAVFYLKLGGQNSSLY